MHTTNEIHISGDIDKIRPQIFQLAADIQHWPTILPHYRYMRILDSSDRHKTADFGASRSGIPVSWRARQELFPEDYRITFIHTGGATKGMWVEWRLQPKGDGIHVTIEHKLDFPIPLLGPFVAKYIIGRLFVESIAGETLKCIKSRVEGT